MTGEASTNNNEKRASIFGGGEKRPSMQKGSISEGYGKIPLKQIITAPSQSHSRITPGGQVFLCAMGFIISVAICIWLVFFSNEEAFRRAVFGSCSAFCALLFGLLTAMTIHRAKNPPEPEALPDLSQRRSTIGARIGKKSVSNTGLSEDPTQVLVQGTRG